MPILKVRGSYFDIGFQIGQQFSDLISEYIQKCFLLAEHEFAKEKKVFSTQHYYDFADRICKNIAVHAPKEFEEVTGVSKATKTDIRDLVFALGYSDIIDILLQENQTNQNSRSSDECTSFIINHGSYSHVVVGETWDMPPETNRYARLFHKIPDGDPSFYSYTLVLGLSYMGLNEHGIAIGTTNLATTDTGFGLIFPVLIQKVLHEETIGEAIKLLRELPKASSHYFYLADSSANTYGVEVSKNHFTAINVIDDVFVHTNHFISSDFESVSIDYSSSSAHRCDRMATLLSSTSNCDVHTIINLLSNHDDGICRHPGLQETSETSGVILFYPKDKMMVAGFGSPCNLIELITVSF